ncbi:transcriptional enhancer factor TEF-3 isoform X2 [Sciurus carolinensis]|uniref:transcriptional enhancer factor TEF-3 isoform X2 n=1 Tax=Sciurus carolinensis TaxID=30640 RepID=UPI001FB39154|nr:transcriptional enhancer factor TEF-3 isoform X2 [Sciurus carolinensis]
MCGGSGWAGCRGPGPRAGISRPVPPPGRAQPPPLPPASDPPRPRPVVRPGPSPAAPSRASQSPPRGAGGRAATPSGSLPRLRASHTSLHSAHSRRPPCKLEARGWGGPQLPAPSPAAAASLSESQEVAKAGLQLAILLPQPPKHLGLQANIGPAGAPPSRALEGKAGTITSNEWSSPNSPEGSSVSGGSQALDKPIDNDAEGVWSPDIEQSFQEALAIYPPCGRRKIILSDEGKMYGRNELIARYIKLRTGKTRTRKQVSSHIQVLARRKAREIQAKLKDQAAKDKALQSMAAMSSAQIISATAFHSKMALTRGPGYPAVSGFWQGALPGQAGTSHDVKPFSQQTYTVQPPLPLPGPTPSPSAPPAPPWQGRSVASSKLWMLEFSAFLEQQQDPDTYNKHLFVHIGQSSPSYSDPYLEAVDIRQIYDKFPEKKGGLKELFERGPSNAFFLVKFWADLNTNIEDEGSSFYGVSSQYESPENMIITCSTKVCSFGKQVVEKVETEYARYENGHYSYRIHRSPLCEYMINFIHKLKHLPEKYMMNSVLENFTILQVVTNRDTQETLLCIAYVFEVSASEHGAQHHIYRLVKE